MDEERSRLITICSSMLIALFGLIMGLTGGEARKNDPNKTAPDSDGDSDSDSADSIGAEQVADGESPMV